MLHIYSLTYERVMLHIQRSCRTYERVMPHIWKSNVTHMRESCYTDIWRSLATGWRRLIGSLVFIRHFPQKWPKSSGSFVENDLQLRGSLNLRHPVQRSCRTYEGVMLHIHMCSKTPSYIWHDFCICVIWLFHMCDMTPFIYVVWFPSHV